MATLATRLDGRREHGRRTRAELLAATQRLIAERGEAAVRLRDITHAAGANVAAVSYHFGSKDELCKAAIKEAIDALLDAQAAELRALPDEPCVADVAALWLAPILRGIGADADDAHRLQLRVLSRAVADPSPAVATLLRDALGRVDPILLDALGRALPALDGDELRFRFRCVDGMLRFLVISGVLDEELADRRAHDAAARLMPVITGALAGG